MKPTCQVIAVYDDNDPPRVKEFESDCKCFVEFLDKECYDIMDLEVLYFRSSCRTTQLLECIRSSVTHEIVIFYYAGTGFLYRKQPSFSTNRGKGRIDLAVVMEILKDVSLSMVIFDMSNQSIMLEYFSPQKSSSSGRQPSIARIRELDSVSLIQYFTKFTNGQLSMCSSRDLRESYGFGSRLINKLSERVKFNEDVKSVKDKKFSRWKLYYAPNAYTRPLCIFRLTKRQMERSPSAILRNRIRMKDLQEKRKLEKKQEEEERRKKEEEEEDEEQRKGNEGSGIKWVFGVGVVVTLALGAYSYYHLKSR